MKGLIGLVIIIGVVFAVWKVWEVYDQQQTTQTMQRTQEARNSDCTRLPGLNPSLEIAYNSAKEKGVLGVRDFLGNYRGTPHLVDPRLACIEVDYALLLTVNNPAEARRVFNEVKNRVAPSSPIQPRIKQLEASFR